MIEIEQLAPPISEELKSKLFDLWERTFASSYQGFENMMDGGEICQNRDIIYFLRREGEILGTCHLTISCSQFSLGGIGEVVTVPRFRRQGIASAVCVRARDDFVNLGGEALFLGTESPEASRVYHRLGWRKLDGANVMMLSTGKCSPGEFFMNYTSQRGSAYVTLGSCAARVPMIPLILAPHDWLVLDFNVGLFSTRYKVQRSCMGLYPRYETLIKGGKGCFFEARTLKGCLVGLSTAKVDKYGVCWVDGFTFRRSQAIWSELIEAAFSWGRDQGVDRVRTLVAMEDKEKRFAFEKVGFFVTESESESPVQNWQIPSMQLAYSVFRK
ncbi:MAG: hypothetical protein DF168_01028 [Candidatus Moanabacter tarae]|uniref:N-acetyltransferase domain-containing protein n=1 Tax=Candidatus Moanibacter tarae TaxID=2200854 RepID=A0A2Z4ACI5_9BACT|nr:MAG: hypothetical protein DF168_01028 [Candidatus Moanabacter tarae]|tara:strand:+ start:24204 stop:25187 length:984 start_codon:yes stop_codon:yes gene_type:complete